MDAIVSESLRALDHALRERRAEVVRPREWPSASGYAPWVEQVWTNYVSNAVKYGGDPPRVTLGADPGPGGSSASGCGTTDAGITAEEPRPPLHPVHAPPPHAASGARPRPLDRPPARREDGGRGERRGLGRAGAGEHVQLHAAVPVDPPRAGRAAAGVPFAVSMALLRLLAAALLVATATLPAFAQGPARLLVHAGRLVDGVSPAAREMVTVLVEGDRIADVVDGYRLPAPGEKVLDLSGSTVLPGFIDLHVHLGMEMSPASYLERFTWNPADLALRAAAHARTTLRAGFTTVRNLGDGYNETVSLRDAIRQGWVEGPRNYTAGKSISTTGGHVDPTNGWCDLIEGDPGPKEGVANGPDGMAKAVRQRYKDRADLVKIATTGGVLSLARSPNAPQFTEDEVAAVVRTARDYDLPVAVHAHGVEGMKRAIRAGVDSLEHGTQMDEETMKLLSAPWPHHCQSCSLQHSL